MGFPVPAGRAGVKSVFLSKVQTKLDKVPLGFRQFAPKNVIEISDTPNPRLPGSETARVKL